MNQQNQVSPPAKEILQDEELDKKLNEVKKLEAELKRSKDEILNGELRQKLCVSATKLITGYPGFALENKLCHRLWNSCFYTQIKALQNAIVKESTRKRRKKEANAKNDTSSNDERLNNLRASLIKETTETLRLYEYIINNYEGKLRALEKMKENDRICIVPIYFKLLIHSGDLHRYSKNFPKAEVCYRKASQLAPGHGNPFNQLAVISQSYDTATGSQPKTCEALYWYMRSLLVTFERFQTTPKNLLNLFKSNKHWIANNPLQVLDSSNRSKKPFGEKQKQQKQAATRYFFAKFIDLISCFVPTEFFLSSSNSEKGEKHDESKELLEVKKSADFVINKFRSFVKDQAFSDALLIKMIVINTSSYILANKSNLILVLSFGNLFASVLADHVLSSIAYVHGGNPEKPMSIIKAFTPLLLWCEWFGSLDADEFLRRINKYPKDLFHKKATRNFFDKISSLAKELQGHDTSLADDCISLKEHDHLRGFKPFVSFIDHTPKASYFPGDAKDNSPEKGYLISSEAAQLLQQSNSCSSTNNEQETAHRICRFLEFSSRCKFAVWDDDANQYVHKKIDLDEAAEAEDDFEENVVFNAGTGFEDGIVTDADSDTAGQNSIETGEILEDKMGNNNNNDDGDGALKAEEEEEEEEDDDDDEEADEIVYTGIQNHKKLPQAYQAQPSAPAPAPAPEKQQTFSVGPSVSKPTFTTNNNDLPLPPQEIMKKAAAAAPLTLLESISLPTPPTKENNKSLLSPSSSALETPKTNHHHQVTTLLSSISTTGPPPGYINNNISNSFQAPAAPAQKKLPPPPGFGSTSSTTPLTSGPVSGLTTFTNINTNTNNGTGSDAPNPGFSFMTSSSLSTNELPLPPPPPQNNSVLPQQQQQQVVTKNRLSSFPALNDDDNDDDDVCMENHQAIRTGTGTGIGRTIESNNNKNDTSTNPYIGMESHNPFLGVGIDFSKVLYLNDQRYECKQQNKTTSNNNTNDIYNIDLSSSAVANSFLFGNPSSSSSPSLLSSLDNKSMNNNNNAREQQQKNDVINPFEASWNPFLRREMR